MIVMAEMGGMQKLLRQCYVGMTAMEVLAAGPLTPLSCFSLNPVVPVAQHFNHPAFLDRTARTPI